MPGPHGTVAALTVAIAFVLCVTASVVLAHTPVFAAPAAVATLDSPTPCTVERTELDKWMVTYNVLKHLSPPSPHLRGVDTTDTGAVKTAIAAEEVRLYEAGYPELDTIVDALFQVQPDLYFVQIGAHGEEPEHDVVMHRVAAFYKQHGHVVSGLVVDPFREALDLAVKHVQPVVTADKTKAGIVTGPYAVCSHNGNGVMHGKIGADGVWQPSYMPWRRDPEADPVTVQCRTLHSLRLEFDLNKMDVLQVATDGYEMETLTGFSSMRPHIVWYRHLKMSPSHIRFLERKLERSGYVVQYHDDGFAWGWLVNPNNLKTATRSRVSSHLIPGVARVEAPLPVQGRLVNAPLRARLPPAVRRYVMHGDFLRNYCYYIVLDKPRHVAELTVVFGKSFEFPDKVAIEAAYDERDPGARGGYSVLDGRVYPVRSTHHARSIHFHSLGEVREGAVTGDLTTGGAVRKVVADKRWSAAAGDKALITRLRLRCDATIKEFVGSLAVDAIRITFADVPHGHGDEL